MRQILNVLIILCNSLLFSQTISEKSPYEYLFDEEQILITKKLLILPVTQVMIILNIGDKLILKKI